VVSESGHARTASGTVQSRPCTSGHRGVLT
jgi:hypothetical protein